MGLMTMPTELKQCPFCGETPSYIRNVPYECQCINDECGIRFRAIKIKHWNTRHETPLQAAAPDLLAALKSIICHADSAINCYYDCDTSEDQKQLRAAYCAIEKAEGREC